MKKKCVVSALTALLFMFMTGSALAQCGGGTSDEARVERAECLLKIDANNYETRVNYYADDIVYKDPFFTNTGRAEMLDYLAAMYGSTPYGYPDDRVVTIKDSLFGEVEGEAGIWTYIATIEWSGTFGSEFFIQTGMSIMKFRTGESSPFYHRDYWSEGDTWWNIPSLKPFIAQMRGMYINLFGLTGRCFDDDGDGYTKYIAATGCTNAGLDCNDFVPGINPGATELSGNGIDDDCNPGTPD